MYIFLYLNPCPSVCYPVPQGMRMICMAMTKQLHPSRPTAYMLTSYWLLRCYRRTWILKATNLEYNQAKELKNLVRYSASPLKDSQKENLISAVLGLFNTEKIFLQNDINVILLADKLKVNRNYLSQVRHHFQYIRVP